MKLSLERTWKETLAMWKYIDHNVKPFDDVYDLKVKWLKLHGYERETIEGACFFCQHSSGGYGCGKCPGRLVDRNFNCTNSRYAFDTEPRKFYRKLLQLNAIRLSEKETGHGNRNTKTSGKTPADSHSGRKRRRPKRRG